MDVVSYLLGKKAGGGSTNLQVKNVEVTENGETTITPDSGYSGLSRVNLTTNVSGTTASVSGTTLILGGASVENEEVII